MLMDVFTTLITTYNDKIHKHVLKHIGALCDISSRLYRCGPERTAAVRYSTNRYILADRTVTTRMSDVNWLYKHILKKK
jgi:hypothetical protein